MEREEYLRLVREGYALAFEKGDLNAGAEQYAVAFGYLARDDAAYSHHHGEYAAVLWKLGRKEEALAQSELALAAAMEEARGDPDPIGVAIQRYFLGERLVDAGRYEAALEAVAPFIETRTNAAPILFLVRAEALAALGRGSEAATAAAEATDRASAGQRARIAERVQRVLGQS